MSRPLTDRERVLQLEARVAELEEELAAWRVQGRVADAKGDALARLYRLGEAMRPHVPHHGAMAARLVAYLLARPGRVCAGGEIGEAIALGETIDPDRLAKVGVAQARRGLSSLGLSDVIRTVWGQGYLIERANVARVMALTEPHHG